MGNPWYGRSAHLLDAAVVVWCATWIWLGVAVAQEVGGLAGLSDTAGEVGQAVEQTGGAIGTLSDVPLVGDRVGEAGETVSEAGRSAVASARESRESVERTSTLLGMSIALIPTIPVVLAYLPRRLAARRTRREVADALAHGRSEDVRPYLAMRALSRLPLERLPRRGDLALADLAAGRYGELAEAELRHMGIDAPAVDGELARGEGTVIPTPGSSRRRARLRRRR
jgi:hypothetical protein